MPEHDVCVAVYVNSFDVAYRIVRVFSYYAEFIIVPAI